MRAVYLFVAVLGLTQAVPVEFLTKFNVDTIKEILNKLNKDDIKESITAQYVENYRDSVKNFDVEQLKEYLSDSSIQYNGPIETVILQLLESVRDILVNGTDTIPVLDPLTIDRIHIGDKILPSSSYITINDLTVKDISTFQVDELRFRTSLIRHTLDFDIAIPAVNVNTSSYALSLTIFGGDVFGKGNLHLTVAKPRVKGSLTLRVRISASGLFVTIEQCRIQISLDSFQPVITGLFNDQTVSDFVAAFLRNLVPEMLEFFEEDITNILSRVVLEVGNLILADLDIGSLLPSS